MTTPPDSQPIGRINEQDIMDLLLTSSIRLPPLEISLVRTDTALGDSARRRQPDALVDMAWGDQQQQRFVVEIKATSTPKAVDVAASQATAYANPPATYPMVLVPFLSEDEIARLEKRGVCGVDLSGNGVVMVPGRLFVLRSGQPNRFRESRTIRNVYRGASSVVARVLLVRSPYASVTEVFNEIRSRSGNVVLSTVSKALKRLDEDLVVSRKAGQIKLLQPDRLIDRLAENYERPSIRDAQRVKSSMNLTRLFAVLKQVSAEERIRLAVTGASSANRYTAMAQERILSVYCSRLRPLLSETSSVLDAATRFPNIEFLETRDPSAYFDTRSEDGIPWASPIQTYLELIAGDKRQRQVAEQVRMGIISESAGAEQD